LKNRKLKMNRISRLAAQVNVDSIQFSPEEHQQLVNKFHAMQGQPAQQPEQPAQSQYIPSQARKPMTNTGGQDPTVLYNPQHPQNTGDMSWYDPENALDEDWLQNSMKRQSNRKAVIRHEGSDWTLYDHTGKKKLGVHPSKESAEAQERAIQVHKHASISRQGRLALELLNGT